jgi:hypothetical protein
MDLVSGYVPASLKSHLPAVSSLNPWASHASPEHRSEPVNEPEQMTWAGFDVADWPSADGNSVRSEQVLLCAYASGFSIWMVGGASKIGGSAAELVSYRGGPPVRSLRMLPSPQVPDSPQQPFYSHRPLAAVLTMPTADPQLNPNQLSATTLRLFSLKTNDFVHSLRFAQEVISVEANQRVISVQLRDVIYVFDANSLAKLRAVKCFPIEVPCMALGARWLACAARTPAPSDPAAPTATYASDPLWRPIHILLRYLDTAREVAAGVYRGLVGPGENPEQLASSAGSVQVLDTLSGVVHAHWRAHYRPLSALAWEPRGSLLLTAGDGARSIHVYRLENDGAKQLYKLVRGMTPSRLTCISVALDSSYVAATSVRGTTHVWTLNDAPGPAPGGPPYPVVNALTRVKPLAQHGSGAVPTSSSSATTSSSSSLHLSNGSVTGTGSTGTSGAAEVARVACWSSAGSSHAFGLAEGLLLRYAMPRGEPQACFDLRRRRAAPPFPAPGLTHPGPPPLPPVPAEPPLPLLNNVELQTHMPPSRPLWAGPQFVFISAAGVPEQLQGRTSYGPRALPAGPGSPGVQPLSADLLQYAPRPQQAGFAALVVPASPGAPPHLAANGAPHPMSPAQPLSPLLATLAPPSISHQLPSTLQLPTGLSPLPSPPNVPLPPLQPASTTNGLQPGNSTNGPVRPEDRPLPAAPPRRRGSRPDAVENAMPNTKP